ncbi:PAS domain S-box protein [Azoarcus sp. KH32C]|uniref:PAS domain S-box protein n=1 Tax=Azoarcus sp. KH32C TaxID=748247 RepID=UPI0002386522|nr:PAS domain S-box protein [Azoarcus sp. KH32C]BAL25225.1 PAS/PAC sensor signal transduction histidine kinase [Azoarcus sp. KH32C]
MRADELDFHSLVEFAPERGAIQFSGRRAILLHTDAMGALRKELVETLGVDIAKVILTRYGFSCGHEDAGLLPGFMNPDTTEEFVRGGPRVHMFSGIAEVETHSVEVDRERGRYRMSGYWRRSYEAEQHLRLFGRSDEAVCWTLAGYASGFASYVFQTDMICVEHECEGRGDDHCAWTLMNATDCAPELADLRRYFQPLNIKDRINVLEGKVYERTRELEASEQRYRNLIEDLPEMVFALHVSGRMVQLNKAGRLRLGIAEKDLPGMRLKDLVLPEYRAKAASFLKSIANARAATQLDVVMRDTEGRDIPMRLQVEPVLKDDKIVGYSGLAIDITAQQERERKLTEYAARLENREQQIQDIINDAVYILDLDARLSFVNARMAELLGVPADRAIGRRCGELMLHSSALRVERDFRRRLDGEGPAPFEIMLALGDGTKRLLEVSSAVLSTGGQVEGVIGVVRDISARREMERQLAQANRLSALGQFASGIAHEINNPLGLVSGFAEELQALMENIPGVDANPELEVLRRGLTTIQEQAQRCKAITDNLLLFSRKQAVPIEPVDAGMFVRERLASYREIGLTRGLDVALQIETRLPVIATNPTLLDQVLRNLLKNAGDAMPGGGRVEIVLKPAVGGADLEVLDEGPGLPAGVIDHVFDPFFTTKAPGRGTGLGLSICYGILSELGGRIDCGNRPQGGAWFRIHLPADDTSLEADLS